LACFATVVSRSKRILSRKLLEICGSGHHIGFSLKIYAWGRAACDGQSTFAAISFKYFDFYLYKSRGAGCRLHYPIRLFGAGTLDRLDPVTGAPHSRYQIAPGTEGIAFGNAGRLWAVSEAGSRHIYDHPFLDLFQPFFFRWSSRWTSLAWSEAD
jgi:hypothetical protein